MNATFSKKLNHGSFETWTTKPDISLFHATQVHGTDIVSTQTLPCEADGLFSSWTDLDRPLAIKTADCLPIIIEGESGVVFLHAGWKGLAHGILDRPEIDMIKPVSVFIGPSIRECCFEVSQDFNLNFPDSPHFRKVDHHYFFNLQAEAESKLRKKYPSLLIQISSICTCCDTLMNSYRRNKTTERNWNLYIKG